MKSKIVLFLLLSVLSYAKDVLLLHSYHKGYEWTDSVSRGIEDNFKNTDIQLTTEYMDTKKIYNKPYLENLMRFYQKRYKNRKFDIVIASDNNALNFLNTYHDKIFTNTPIIFCGINNFDKSLFDSYIIKNRTTGVVEKVDIEKNIKLIQKLHPNLSKLLVLNDMTITGQQVQKEFFEIYEKYKDKINIEYVDKFKIKELKQKVKELPKDTVILLLLLFKDDTGEIFTFKDGLQQIEKVSSVPIYGLWDFYIDHGLVGGFLTNAYNQGDYASKIAKKVLNGTNIKNIPIVDVSPNSYIFNYKKLKEFNIKEKVFLKILLLKSNLLIFMKLINLK